MLRKVQQISSFTNKTLLGKRANTNGKRFFEKTCQRRIFKKNLTFWFCNWSMIYPEKLVSFWNRCILRGSNTFAGFPPLTFLLRVNMAYDFLNTHSVLKKQVQVPPYPQWGQFLPPTLTQPHPCSYSPGPDLWSPLRCLLNGAITQATTRDKEAPVPTSAANFEGAA